MEISKQLISHDASHVDVIQKLDAAPHKVLFVVDQKNRLVGSISDGDIRRFLIHSQMNNVSAGDICNKNPAHFDCYGKFHHHVMNNFKLIPVLDSEGRVKDIRMDSKSIGCDTMVIMAGGLGTRLGQLTSDKPKPLVNVSGKPMIDHIIANAYSQGVNYFILCLNHMAEQIVTYLRKYDGTEISIEYVVEEQKLDTAGALSLIPVHRLPDNFFVKNCDVFETLNYRSFYEFHKGNNSILSIMTVTNDFQIPFGVIKSNESRVEVITEKPIYSFQVSGGLYILNKRALSYLSFNQPISMPEFANKLIKNQMDVFHYNEDVKWLDAGTILDLEVLEK